MHMNSKKCGFAKSSKHIRDDPETQFALSVDNFEDLNEKRSYLFGLRYATCAAQQSQN